MIVMDNDIQSNEVKIPAEGAKWIAQWQQWLQSRTGKDISQGMAVAVACYWLKNIVDDMVKKLRKEGYQHRADLYENIAKCICNNTDNLEDLFKGESEANQELFNEMAH